MRSFLLLVVIVTLMVPAISAQRRIVCYYGTWATYRAGNGQFDVENINPHLCTHIIYSFFGVTEGGDVTFLDPGLDLLEDYGRGNIQDFIGLKDINPNVKLLAAFGGYNFGSETFSALAQNSSARINFARNTLSFLRRFGFDGIDLDWEFPGQRGGIPADRENFVLMLAELRNLLQPQGLLVTAAVGATEYQAAVSYDIPGVSAQVDFINLMTYDFHGFWDGFTGIHGALFQMPGAITDFQRKLNIEACVRFWLARGAPANKLVVGIPTYGRTFTLTNAVNNGILAASSGAGLPGPYLNEFGGLGFNEICLQSWTKMFENTQQVPFAFSGNQWVGYDDVQSIRAKCSYINQNNLGGAMIWSLETDDFRGTCGQGNYPLLSTINSSLR